VFDADVRLVPNRERSKNRAVSGFRVIRLGQNALKTDSALLLAIFQKVRSGTNAAVILLK
jgi:hypothetical protein